MKPTATSVAPTVGFLPAPGPDRIPLGTPELVTLEASLAPIEGSKHVLAFVDHAGGQALIGQVLSEQGPHAAPFVIPRAHFTRAFESSTGTITLATVEANKICLRELENGKPTSPACFDAPAYAIASSSDRFLLFDLRDPEPEEEEAAADPKATKAKAKPASDKPKPKPKAKPKKPPKKGKKDKKKPPISHKEAIKKLLSSGHTVELWSTPISRESGLGEATFTNLSFQEAMTGLGFIGIGGRKDRYDVVFYERAEKKGKESRGKIGVAALDGEGVYDPASRKAFGESKLEPAFLADHWDARLITWSDGAALLGHRGPRGKCDITVISPFVMQMIPDANDCALDPKRFLTIARAKNKGVEPDLEEPAPLSKDKVRRAFGQAAWDVGRSVYSTDRTWTFDGDDLVFYRNQLTPQKAARALEAERLRISWGAFAPDGSGIAQLDSGLAVIDDKGNVGFLKGIEARRVGGPERDDIDATNRTLAVKIGATWWQARGELAKLYPATGAPLRPLPHDTTVAVGGATTGMVLELAPPNLRVERLDAEGKRDQLGMHATFLAPGFDAVQRGAGGAIVVGPDSRDRRRIVSYAIAEDGTMSAEREVALFGPDASRVARFVRLVALPKGGALLYDEARTRVGWLDDDGALLKVASLPASEAVVTCVDGRPAPAKIASVGPGELIDFPGANATTCLSSDTLVAPDGTIRWFGSTTDGISSRAELGLVPSKLVPVAFGTTPGLAMRKPAGTVAPRCPTEMVLVGSDLCVDRFESTLFDEITGRNLSPDYAGTPGLLSSALGEWATKRERQGDLRAQSLPLPIISKWQRTSSITPVADSRMGIRPNGFVTGLVAKSACEAAGKRLCKHEEWKRACRGERDTMFPYGDSFEEGTCNVNMPLHPGAFLHDNASVGHLDPRLNRVESPEGTVLQVT
ncbi:MAG: hypothetical protein HOW73_35100, partial [Polyangiaceae bacterium]|nr:hypothetical protein [Polyangiaceae bacterium]